MEDHNSEEVVVISTSAESLIDEIKMENADILQGNENQEVFKPAKPAKRMKGQIIDDIIKLETEMGTNDKPRTFYERMTKGDLEMYLGQISNEAIDMLREGDTITEDEDPGKTRDRLALGAKALYNFNLIVVKVLELGSINFREKLGTSLEGMTKDVIDNREQLEEILGEIYQENAEVLTEYLTPLNKYFLLMTGIAGNRLMVNKSKNAEEIKKKD